VPEGAKLMLSVGAANRDPGAYEDPDTFNPARDWPKDHLSFGRGIHLCLGAHLARIEMGIILNQMLDRFATLDLVDDGPLAFPPNIAFRGPVHLPARWTAA
jgi:cytochrome P450